MFVASQFDGTDGGTDDGTRQVPPSFDGTRQVPSWWYWRRAEAKNIESAGFGATLTKCMQKLILAHA